MVRASTLALHLNLNGILGGLELLSIAHPGSALLRFVPPIMTSQMASLKPVANTAVGAMTLSVLGSQLLVAGLMSAMKIRDRTVRVGEKWFMTSNVAMALNCFAFRARVAGVFPLFFVMHAVIAALFHLGDGFVVPIKMPSLLGRTKPSGGKKPTKKTSSKKTAKKAPARASSRSSRKR